MNKLDDFISKYRKRIVFVAALTVVVSSAMLMHYSTNPLATIISMGAFMIGASVAIVTVGKEIDE